MPDAQVQKVESFVAGQWIGPGPDARPIASAVTGRIIAEAGDGAIDTAAMLAFAKERGGPSLRKLTFHDRARLLKAIAMHLDANKKALYDISYATGATRKDHAFDIDGGIGTTFVYASKGRREMPDDHVLRDGPVEQLSRNGTFLGQHVFTPKPGVAVHINAFNFPVWGMLEKLAPCILAGMPCIVKPATATSYVTEACVRLIVESGQLPDGALQLVTGSLGRTFEALDFHDSVTFTGSAATAAILQNDGILRDRGVSFTAEQDSLNATLLGPDLGADDPELDIFADEVLRELTTKAGQKCTAIRRIIVPQARLEQVKDMLVERLSKVTIGDPRQRGVAMGALVSSEQKTDTLQKADLIGREAARVFGSPDHVSLIGEDVEGGSFLSPQLFLCDAPDTASYVHDTEAFGPVATLVPYDGLAHGLDLINRGQGSLVASIVTRNPDVAREAVLHTAAFHGRLHFNNRDSAAESTGHGAPMPHMVHGGPGRAGGGEELGGIRAVKHFMQRTAVQGSPDLLSAIGGAWIDGAKRQETPRHPFRMRFDDLQIGQAITTEAREITLADIEHFAEFTGDRFYAHMDEEAAARNPFFPGRVAHGYLLLSFAAGLFVDPDEGPVLANTGLDNLRFRQPVVAGDEITVTLTVMHKTPRTSDYGEIRWHVVLTNQKDETVATYELLTMVAK